MFEDHKLSFLAMGLTLFLLSLFSPLALASVNPVSPTSGSFHLGAKETYFSSSENFSSGGGGYESIANGGQFQEFQTSFLLDYDLTNSWRITSDFGMSRTQTSTNTYDNANFHLDEFHLGGEKWFHLANIPLALHTQVGIPLYEPNLTGGESFGTNGVFTGELGGSLRPRFKDFQFHLSASYLYRSKNLSHLLPWSAGASYFLPVGQIGGGVRGFQSITSDSDDSAGRTERSTAIANLQGGSLTYRSVDPNLMQVFVDSRWGIFKGVDFSTDFAYDFNGKSYGKGFYIGAGVHWMFSMNSLLGQSEMDSSNENFRVKSKNYQEDLFQNSNPKKKPRARKRSKQKSFKQLMDEVEENLEP